MRTLLQYAFVLIVRRWYLDLSFNIYFFILVVQKTVTPLSRLPFLELDSAGRECQNHLAVECRFGLTTTNFSVVDVLLVELYALVWLLHADRACMSTPCWVMTNRRQLASIDNPLDAYFARETPNGWS